MTPPLHNAPTSGIVVRAWARSVLPPTVGVDRALPAEATEDMRSVGFVVGRTIGGGPDRWVPIREPVAGFECWVAPPANNNAIVQWNAAERLANWLIAAAYAHPVTGVVLDLAALGFGAYRPARVLTILPVSEPREAPDDPSNYARFDIDMQINWTEN